MSGLVSCFPVARKPCIGFLKGWSILRSCRTTCSSHRLIIDGYSGLFRGIGTVLWITMQMERPSALSLVSGFLVVTKMRERLLC